MLYFDKNIKILPPFYTLTQHDRIVCKCTLNTKNVRQERVIIFLIKLKM